MRNTAFYRIAEHRRSACFRSPFAPRKGVLSRSERRLSRALSDKPQRKNFARRRPVGPQAKYELLEAVAPTPADGREKSRRGFQPRLEAAGCRFYISSDRLAVPDDDAPDDARPQKSLDLSDPHSPWSLLPWDEVDRRTPRASRCDSRCATDPMFRLEVLTFANVAGRLVKSGSRRSFALGVYVGVPPLGGLKITIHQTG